MLQKLRVFEKLDILFFNKDLFIFQFPSFPDDKFFSNQPSQSNRHFKDRLPQLVVHPHAERCTQALQDSDEK